jgi:hypothetical protein
MFDDGEQRARVPDEDRRSLALILVALLSIYTGLSTAVAGFVLDITELVIAGLVLVCCASLPISRVAKRWAKLERVYVTRAREVSSASHCIHC